MPTKIHLVTVVGSYVKVLPHMLRHYRDMGITSFFVNVHLSCQDDPIINEVRQITDDFGCDIASVTVGKWLHSLNPRIYSETRAPYLDDWIILADQDELQVYPKDIHAITRECEEKGYSYIEGSLLDRIGPEGTFPEIRYDRPIWEQFPLAGLISYPILGAYPRKIVAAKGSVKIGNGQHRALTGHGCHKNEYFIPVHHFKWVDGIADRLEERARFYEANNEPFAEESRRFVDYYYAHNGRICITDTRLHISQCVTEYKYWDMVRDEIIEAEAKLKL